MYVYIYRRIDDGRRAEAELMTGVPERAVLENLAKI